MSLLYAVLILLAVGVGLWFVNTHLSPYLDGRILKLINAVVIIAVVYWLLVITGIWAWLSAIKMPG